MSSDSRKRRNPAIQRFAHACTVSLATFVTSGAGLLAYVKGEARPGWLEALAVFSACMVVATFAGWLLFSVASIAHDSVTRANRS